MYSINVSVSYYLKLKCFSLGSSTPLLQLTCGMPKRKRQEPIRPAKSYTAGPIDEHSGQRSVFPELVKPSHKRDKEWRYDEEEDAAEVEDQDFEAEDFTGQTFSLDQLDFGMDEEEDDEEQEEEGEEEMEPVGEEWEVEPQDAALEYLQAVRIEADALPNLTYVPDRPSPAIESTTSKSAVSNGINIAQSNGVQTNGSDADNTWRTQFLTYYTNLRNTIASTSEPNLTQNELDSLLHINPNRRPTTSTEEDGIWRQKTLDQPSVTLLAMLDHQRTIHLLTHLRKKMAVNVKVEQCIWLVFLLARLGDVGVLSGDEMDLLRRIGRKCFTVKKSLEETGEESGQREETVLATTDMVICIIRHFYHQMDLEA